MALLKLCPEGVEEGEVVIMEEVEAEIVQLVVEDLHIVVDLHAYLLHFQLLVNMVTGWSYYHITRRLPHLLFPRLLPV